MPPSTIATSTAKKIIIDDEKQEEGVNWGGTVAAVMVLLVLALVAFGAAIYVWFLVLKRQQPELKVLISQEFVCVVCDSDLGCNIHSYIHTHTHSRHKLCAGCLQSLYIASAN